ncbi:MULTISPECIES: GNAT family N-acetyltransferase [unclassified Facklamia]|uniref:GNAT family N-acetyltransferase n=1 Tax=Aerococcaceae TaxID=186827 RepID=UPI0013BBF528|nr:MULTISPECIES: GNAT family N-acetyltransferase [unclassified Facklamia]NEW64057.1 GNAT family N-acetyltransferase [Facklamia sp. 252]NEW67514.1 GNAT family N-acetyltransferase [Facklamia sp. 253]QQD65766.1 GNAT family N-acetyltransferase [Aerococcaceae bacterium zg-252]
MWQIKTLSNMNYQEIYQLFKLRTDIFVVEQQCAYPEIDEWDLTCRHGLKFDEEQNIVACFRIIEDATHTRIGRVAVMSSLRGTGLAHELMETAIKACSPNRPIQISAQAHLIYFYEKHGFESVGEIYLEDGIPHIEMNFGQS